MTKLLDESFCWMTKLLDESFCKRETYLIKRAANGIFDPVVADDEENKLKNTPGYNATKYKGMHKVEALYFAPLLRIFIIV